MEPGFWNEKTNQLRFMEDLKKKLGIKNPSDWGKITLKTVSENGGRTLIKIHGGSLLKTLQALYPGSKICYSFHR